MCGVPYAYPSLADERSNRSRCLPEVRRMHARDLGPGLDHALRGDGCRRPDRSPPRQPHVVVFVAQGDSRGGELGFHWARRHPDRIAAMAFMETIIKSASWDEWPANARDIFQGFRTPGTGEQLILDQNMFVEGVLPGAMLHQLTPEEMDAYRAPFREPAHRLPTLVWPREIPIDGEPADVVELVNGYDRWLASSDDVPKLLLTFEPGAIM